jgi:Uma2 family endonuclease
LAETYDHLLAILATLVALTHYLLGQQATVLADQFLYYSQGFPRLRIAPDVMVILGVEPGGRDNYKIWEEGQVPAVIFEITSEGTRKKDEGFKKTLYEQLGVLEYWQFDPRGEWIDNHLRGYRLVGEAYELIPDGHSEVLQLRLAVEDKLIGFYRDDTGEKLLVPDELYVALRREMSARREAEERADREQRLAEQARQLAEQEQQRSAQLEALLAQYRDRFGELPP